MLKGREFIPLWKINNAWKLRPFNANLDIYHYPRSQQNMKNREFSVTSKKIMIFSSHTSKTAVIKLSISFNPYRNLLNTDQQTNRKHMIGSPHVVTNFFFTNISQFWEVKKTQIFYWSNKAFFSYFLLKIFR